MPNPKAAEDDPFRDLLVERGARSAFADTILREYEARTGLSGRVFQVELADAAGPSRQLRRNHKGAQDAEAPSSSPAKAPIPAAIAWSRFICRPSPQAVA